MVSQSQKNYCDCCLRICSAVESEAWLEADHSHHVDPELGIYIYGIYCIYGIYGIKYLRKSTRSPLQGASKLCGWRRWPAFQHASDQRSPLSNSAMFLHFTTQPLQNCKAISATGKCEDFNHPSCFSAKKTSWKSIDKTAPHFSNRIASLAVLKIWYPNNQPPLACDGNLPASR